MQATLFTLGFRPFFLLALFHAAFSVALWITVFAGVSGLVGKFDMLWHGHEMLHGFAVAAIFGFLSTAAQTWTGVRSVHGMRLAALVGLWVGGRAAMLVVGTEPDIVAAVLDLSFLPLAGALLAFQLGRSGQRHNQVFLLLFAVLWSGNAAYHLERWGILEGWAQRGLHLALGAVILMIVIIGGRVIPFFSERAVSGYARRHLKGLTPLAMGTTVTWAVAKLAIASPSLVAALALLAAIANAARLGIWADRRILRIPILCILYVGYAWLPIGFGLDALAFYGIVSSTVATHAFTAGAIGTMIVAMISRVSLGHTGRPIQAARATVWAYGLVTVGAIFRVVGPMALPTAYVATIAVSGVLWAAGFVFLFIEYAGVLLAPRVDGKPG